MSRGLFGTIVMLGIILLVIFMASCESKSGRMARIANTQVTVNVPKPGTVKIVLVKHTANVVHYKQFRVHKVNDGSIYFWTTTLPYEVGDTVTVLISALQQ